MRFRLIPRDEGFYPLFSELATIGAECARRLESILTSPPVESEAVEAIIALEQHADEITRTLRTRLERSLVTPFDREDIQTLVIRLDDVVDEIRDAANTAHIHVLSSQLPELREILALLVKACDTNVRLVANLSSFRDISQLVDEIDSLESEADIAYRTTTAALFSGRYDALDVLRWKDVVDAVESSIDAVESAADIVQAIFVKHA